MNLWGLAQIEACERNGEVVARALRRVGVSCSACVYPENALEFAECLRKYVEGRIHAGRLRRWWVLCDDEREADELAGRLKLALDVVELLRARLKRIWPCGECMRRWNPTGRLAWGRTRFPENEGVLECLTVLAGCL